MAKSNKDVFNKGLGCKKQKQDIRDHIYKAPSATLISLPKSINYKFYDSPIEDQGHLGSCTANATTAVLEFLEIKNKLPKNKVLAFIKMLFIHIWRGILRGFISYSWTLNLIFVGALSRLFVYYNTRVIEGSVDYDAGAEIRDTIKALVDQGVCPEKEWPYNIWMFKNPPADYCYKHALDHQVEEYKALTTLEDMKGCLASGYPFVFCFAVYDSFKNMKKDGIMTIPKPEEEMIGLHAVMAIGYDDTTKRFLIRNSWGRAWGNKGYFTMPYEFITDISYACDFWTMTKAEGI